jgi:predicted metal-dependent hydrolase
MSFSYSLIRSKRKSLSISIKSQKIIVRAPLRLSLKYVENFVEKNKNWILEKLNKNLETEERFKNKHFVFGTELEKQEIQNIAEIEDFKIGILKNYLEHKVYQYLKIMNLDKPEITLGIKKYKSKWGSCSYKKALFSLPKKVNLKFNSNLINFTKEVIDYVIIHEIAHIKHLGHGSNFWNFVSEFCPDYKNLRKQLVKSTP